MAGFICIREPSVCHVVSITRREDPGMRMYGGHYYSRLLSFGEFRLVYLQRKEKSSSFLTFVLSDLCQLYCKESCLQT